MDATEDHFIERLEMKMENQLTVDDDISAGLSDETQQHQLISEGFTSCCRKVRPKLHTTKSFPPYNQRIGGLGEDRESEDEIWLDSNVSIACHEEMREERRSEGVRGTERREDTELTARCAREEVKAKWRARRKEKLGGSLNSEVGRGEAEDKERRDSASLGMEGESKGKDEASGRKSGEGEEPLEIPESSKAHQWSCPHPGLSRLLHSSTTSSTSSSINLSSAESDDVFSEGEDAGSKRKMFRKVRTVWMDESVVQPQIFSYIFSPAMCSPDLCVMYHTCVKMFWFSMEKGENNISQLFLAHVVVVICMGLKEDFDTDRFEWHLHGCCYRYRNRWR